MTVWAKLKCTHVGYLVQECFRYLQCFIPILCSPAATCNPSPPGLSLACVAKHHTGGREGQRSFVLDHDCLEYQLRITCEPVEQVEDGFFLSWKALRWDRFSSSLASPTDKARIYPSSCSHRADTACTLPVCNDRDHE